MDCCESGGCASIVPLKDQKDKRRYILVWLVAGLLLLGYAIWLIVKVADAYEHPGAKIGVDPNQPPFPVFAVCFWDLDDPSATPKVSALHTLAEKNKDPVYTGFKYSEFVPELYDEDGETYSKCIQFNAGPDATVKANKGSVQVIVQTAYTTETTHASVHLLVLPAGKVFDENTDPETWDNIILPADAYVDGRWTAQVRKDVDGKATTRYSLAQQSEPLTHERKRELQQTTDLIANLPSCGNPDQDGNACTNADGQTGVCVELDCQFLCANNQSVPIPLTWVCDFIDDCGDNSDEVNCNPPFTCDNDTTKIPSVYVCNGVDDCEDGADEDTCPNYPIFVSAIIQPYTQYVTVTEDYVTFGWESFFASLASGWSIVGVAIAFLFPEEAATYLRWRGTKGKDEEAANAKPTELKSIASPSAKNEDGGEGADV